MFTKVIKRFISICIVFAFSFGIIISPYENSTYNTIEANAASASYNKYYCLEHFISAEYAIGGKCTNIKVSNQKDNYFSGYGTASRKYTEIPNTMNCTLICMTNLVGYYRNKKGLPNTHNSNVDLYNKIHQSAVDMFNFKDLGLGSGLFFGFQKPLMKKAFVHGGLGDCNPATFTTTLGSVNTEYFKRTEPYILSTVEMSHSVLVVGYRSFTLSYKQNGKNKSKDILLLNVLDPSGDYYYVNADNITTAAIESHYLLYIPYFS